MGIFDSHFSKIADRILKNQQRVDKYNELLARHEALDKKLDRLKTKLTEEYKLFSVKPQHTNIRKDVENDILTIKSLPKIEKLTEKQKEVILKMCRKYNLY